MPYTATAVHVLVVTGFTGSTAPPRVPAKARQFKQAERKQLFDETVSAEDQEVAELLKRIAARYEG